MFVRPISVWHQELMSCTLVGKVGFVCHGAYVLACVQHSHEYMDHPLGNRRELVVRLLADSLQGVLLEVFVPVYHRLQCFLYLRLFAFVLHRAVLAVALHHATLASNGLLAFDPHPASLVCAPHRAEAARAASIGLVIGARADLELD